MQAPTFPPRINLAHLTSQIDKNLGPEKAQYYFSYLNRFLNQKLSKSRFNKLCSIILGPENVHLHNQLVLSILKNAHLAKTPPLSSSDNNLVKTFGEAGNRSPITEKRFHASQPTSSVAAIWSNGGILPPSKATTSTAAIWSNGDILPPSQPTSSTAAVWSNGDVLPPSQPTSSTAAIWSNGDILPRPCQWGITDCQNKRVKDKSNSVRPNAKPGTLFSDSLLPFDSTTRENGHSAPCDLRGNLQQQSHVTEQPTKRRRINDLSQLNQVTRHNEGLPCRPPMEERRELEPVMNLSSSRGSLQAPFGIPFCPASVGGACRPLPLASGGSSSFCLDSRNGELCHTDVLKEIMEEIAKANGVIGVTIDSADLLNKGLDVYLKRLIKSCVELAEARSGLESRRQMAFKQQPHGKIIDDIRPGNQVRVHRSESIDESQDSSIIRTVSLLDFKVAMELNPHKLGDDCPLLLGRIYNYSFEE